VGKVGLALLLALLLNHSLKGISVFRGIFFTPVVISFVAVGILWQRIYDPNIGLLDGLLQTLGLMHTPIDWLGNPNLSLFSIILVDIWKWTGYHTVIYLAGLQIISRDFYESADIDGATAWQKLRYITLPQLRQMTIINITIACMGAFSVFDLVYIMTNGGPYQSTSVLLTYMYNITFASSNSNFGYGTTVAYLLFVIILAISIVQIKNMNAKDY
jgi:ABC-type sugar transport system permease subunit